MNKELSRRFGRSLRERFENTVAEPVPASWLELIARLEQREERNSPANRDCASQSGNGQSD
jgi:hypothetical protein